MNEKVRELYCECSEFLGEKDLTTNNIKLDTKVKFTIENKELPVPTIVCKCPYCSKIEYFRGHILC